MSTVAEKKREEVNSEDKEKVFEMMYIKSIDDNSPIGAVGLEIDKEAETVTVVCAFCHPKDNFSYKVAQDKISGRLRGKECKENYKKTFSFEEVYISFEHRYNSEIIRQTNPDSQFWRSGWERFDPVGFEDKLKSVLEYHIK